MQLGIIGLGRMGGNMARRLIRHGHDVAGFAPEENARQALAAEGLRPAASVQKLTELVAAPRAIWLMVPDQAVDDVLGSLVGHLSAGDVVIDGGNSNFKDDIRRARELAARGIDFVDVGTSGGVWGLERGYCLMVGGPDAAVARLEPVFSALAPGVEAAPRLAASKGPIRSAERGYLHCGPTGAGHFVKMVHNAIEYGLMAAYAEGFNVLRHAPFELDMADVAELWRRGSVVGSWLLDLTAAALAQDPRLGAFEGRVGDSGEGRWTAHTAIDAAVPIPVIAAALFSRFTSRGEDDFANRLLSAMRAQFGGHQEPKA
ncbi:MAG TPA: decarboxylating 6-phosphogluconate dehydrogenase [Vicinamibacterales bacterium]|nr:decarboxylating 6-phosphogluconate dehydrogenase [Vicinamibacterales bacterium]